MTHDSEDSSFRIEHDSMGDVRVPGSAKWRAQTQRAVENFPISGRPLEPSQIRALALIKDAAARVNETTPQNASWTNNNAPGSW